MTLQPTSTRRSGLFGLAASLATSAVGLPNNTAAAVPRKSKWRILAFGASNTWGFQPVDPTERVLRRLPFEQRWPGVAHHALGRRFEIVEDALPGRTAAVDRAPSAGQSLSGPAYNGLTELPEALVRNVPLDIVVLQLGTNDLMSDPNLRPEAFCERIVKLCDVVAKFNFPIPLDGQAKPMKSIVMAPTAIGPMASNPNWVRAEETRVHALPLLQAAAREHSFTVFDGAQAVPKPGADGLHFGPDAHGRLGLLAAATIRAVAL
jgi:lysophospholipase L1-like esterase